MERSSVMDFAWEPTIAELKKIEELAYDGYFAPEEIMIALDKNMHHLDYALERDHEQKIHQACLKGHARARADLQRDLLSIARGNDGTKEQIDAIKYILATRYAHNDMSAVTQIQRELKEKELELQKKKLENEERERRLNRIRQRQLDRFKKSAFVLSLAQKADMSEEETRIMADAAGLGDAD